MAIDIIHVSDIHFGSGETHGRINPDTGLNIRFEDFVRAFTKVVDYAIDKDVDIFLFSGDAYRNASPEPIYQMKFARELKRLSDANITTILVVGNHDQILKSTASHAMSVFQSLEVPGLMTIDKPVFKTIDTKNGAFQLIGFPHVTRHQLLTLDKYAGLNAGALDRILVENVSDVLSGYYSELNPELPTVVTAHMTVDTALAGIEEELLIGYTQTFPREIFMDKRVDYVALGHVHKYQVIHQNDPAIVYAGSLERVDFGEEKEDKGFVHVSLARHKTQFTFHSINPRPFVTVDADLVESPDPTEKLLERISKAIKPGCVFRARYRVSQEQFEQMDETRLRAACQEALSFKLTPDILPNQTRARMPQLTEDSVSTPLSAIETYLDQAAPARKEALLERSRELMAELAAELKGDS